MQILIRADANAGIGGGHVMRCLSLGMAAVSKGHRVTFATSDLPAHLRQSIEAAGCTVLDMGRAELVSSEGHWRPFEVAEDVRRVLPAVQSSDWLVLDHYGLGGDWVRALRAAAPDLRIAAMADLDEEPYFADLLLDYAHVVPRDRSHPYLALMGGAQDALLRPEFRMSRPEALKRRGAFAENVLVLPGMMDAAGLAPSVLRALDAYSDWRITVIMGSQSQSRPLVETHIAQRPNWSLTLDATDMAAHMARADLAIGAGGGTSWERCCLGLPSLLIPVAENQTSGVEALVEAGAALGLPPDALDEPDLIAKAFEELIDRRQEISGQAAELCDGRGAERVLGAMEGSLRPVEARDARLLFDWRNQPHIRAISLDPAPLVWENHQSYVEKISRDREDGLWFIYGEGSRDVGHVHAGRRGNGLWHWSFYKGDADGPRGAGQRMLVCFLRLLLKRPDFAALSADILESNTVSIRLHEQLGFRQTGMREGKVLEFRLDRCDITNRLGLPGGA